jgi:2'-5' RNA ligase
VTQPDPPRYAVYLAPGTDAPLWRFGSAFIGHDAETGATPPAPVLPGFSPDALRAMTEEPRRYGFHLTLKAPFRLASGQSEDALTHQLAAIASAISPFEMGRLTLECRDAGGGGAFVCLVPATRCEALHALERTVVIALEPFRAPLTPAEIARRNPQQLSERQQDHLYRYGYPYVMQDFRPHFSLTGRVDDCAGVADAIADALAQEVGAAHFRCDHLALFRQPGRDEPFRIAARFPLAAG